MSHCIFCLENKELTDEHIILKALGGGLSAKLLCKECNSKFGEGLDAEFRNQIQNRIARFTEGIFGRGKRLQGPFEGVEGEIPNLNARIVGGKDFDFKIVSEPEIKISSGKIEVKCAFPENVSVDYVRKTVEYALRRELREKFPKLTEERMNRQVESWMRSFSANEISKQSCDYVVFHDTISLGVLELSYEKIAYELACMCFGEEYYLKSATAEILRKEIIEGNRVAKHHCCICPEIGLVSELLEYLSRQKLNAVLMMDGKASIQIFGVDGIVEYEGEDGDYRGNIFDAKLFTFSYNENCNAYNFYDWLNAEKDRSEEIARLLQRMSDAYGKSL